MANTKARKGFPQAKSTHNPNPRRTTAIARENDTREILRAYYAGTRRDDEHEPPWVHPFFAPVLSGAPLTADHRHVANHLKSGRVEHTHFLGMPRVIDTDGWKVGTSTWIFLRRRSCTPVVYKGWTIIYATFEGVTMWMAYNATHRCGASAMSDDSIGPSLRAEEIKAYIDMAA